MRKKNIDKIKEQHFDKLIWIPEYLASTIISYEKLGFSKEDLKQELKIVLWKSIIKFFDCKNYEFIKEKDLSRYCYSCCQNMKVDYIRKIHRPKRNQQNVVLGNEYDLSNFNENSFYIDLNHNEIIIDNDNIMDIDVFNYEKKIFMLNVIGFNFKEISEKMNLSVGEISKIVSMIKEKIRKKYFGIFENNYFEKTFILIDRIKEQEEFEIVERKERKDKIRISNIIQSNNDRKNKILKVYKKYLEKGGNN